MKKETKEEIIIIWKRILGIIFVVLFFAYWTKWIQTIFWLEDKKEPTKINKPTNNLPTSNRTWSDDLDRLFDDKPERWDLLKSFTADCFEYEYSKWKATYWSCEKIEVYSWWISIDWNYSERFLTWGSDNVELIVAMVNLRDNWATPFLEEEIDNDNPVLIVEWLTNTTIDLNEISTRMYGKWLAALTDEEYDWIEKMIVEYYHSLDKFDIYKDQTWTVIVENLSLWWLELKTTYADLSILRIVPKILDFRDIFKNTLNKDFWNFNFTESELKKLSDAVNKEAWYNDLLLDRFQLYINWAWKLMIKDIILSEEN